jgi:hypothetical protein
MTDVFIFFHEGHLFSSVNDAGPLPPLDTLQSRVTWPLHCRRLHYAPSDYTWLAFVPKNIRWEGPLLHRLATIPLEERNGRWSLSSAAKESWSNLENNLRQALATLGPYSYALVPLEFAPFRLPSSFRYDHWHQHHHDALQAATNGRNAFIPLVAYFSHSISHINNASNDLQHPQPKWTEILKDDGVHDVWVDSVRRSMIGDFSADNPRIGTVVDVATCNYHNDLVFYIKAGLPIWFQWGKQGDTPTSLCRYSPLEKYRPTPQQIAAAVPPSPQEGPWGMGTWSSRPSASKPWPSISPREPLPSSHNPPSLPVPSPVDSFPQPEKYSRQRRGESWQQFFARQETEHAKMEAKESPKAREARLQREKAQENCPAPGKSGATVFLWSDMDGFRIRTSATRGEVEQFWSSYPNSQKRFDGFRNEWDICTEFAPNDYDFDNGCDDFDDESGRDEPKEPLPANYAKDLMAIFDNEIPLPSTERSNADMGTWLYNHFGFICPTWGRSYKQLEFPGAPKRPTWVSTYKLFGYDADPGVAEGMKDAITDFASCLATVGFCPGSHWDLSVSSEHFLGNKTNSLVRVTRQTFERVLYFLESTQTPSSSGPRYRLAVQSAAVALQCLREEWGPRLEDIISHLLRMGMAFTTLVPGPAPNPRAFVPRRCEGLGARKSGYKPDAVDYAEYEYLRRRFCNSERHARAGLMKGGIVWRLVKESLPVEDVLDGPTSDVVDHGCALVQSDGALWDDDLSEEELALICGVYKVDTLSGVNSQSHSSWWPKHTTWMCSVYNVGYWSPANENWFQRRLDLIRAGNADLKTSQQWREQLKNHRGTGKLADKNEAAAVSYLGGERVFE